MNTFNTESSKAHQQAFTVAATAFSAEYLQFVQSELNAAIAAGETAREFSDRLLARQPVPWRETWPVEPVAGPDGQRLQFGTALLRWARKLWKG